MRGTLVDALVTTDQRYFSAGATDEHVGPATLSWVPGYTHLPVGCVVHSVAPAEIADGDRWLDEVESAVRGRGGRVSRVYLESEAQPPGLLEAALARRGYVARTEVAHAIDLPLPEPATGVDLHRLDPDDDDAWRLAAEVHRVGGVGTGIYTVPFDEWTALMRRRCASRAMDGWLATVDGAPCGTVGSLADRGVLRSKNLLVDQRFRRRSIGRSVLSLLSVSTPAADRSRSVGAFAVEGTPGSRFYPGAGFTVVGSQVEWARPLA